MTEQVLVRARLQWLRKTPKSATGGLERARLQPRRSSFSMAYGTAEAVPFQNFEAEEFFRNLFNRAAKPLKMWRL